MLLNYIFVKEWMYPLFARIIIILFVWVALKYNNVNVIIV